MTAFSTGSFATPQEMNRKVPTGGVIAPSCMMMTINTPNWMGSKPSELPMASTVAANMAMITVGSRNMPRITNTTIRNRTASTGLPRVFTAKFCTSVWKCRRTSTLESTPAPTMVMYTTEVVTAESIRMPGMSLHFSVLLMQKPYSRPYRMASTPDSVGVTMPKQMPLRMIRGIMRAPRECHAVISRFLSEKQVRGMSYLRTRYSRYTTPICRMPSRIPGNSAPINRRPTGTSV